MIPRYVLRANGKILASGSSLELMLCLEYPRPAVSGDRTELVDLQTNKPVWSISIL